MELVKERILVPELHDSVGSCLIVLIFAQYLLIRQDRVLQGLEGLKFALQGLDKNRVECAFVFT